MRPTQLLVSEHLLIEQVLTCLEKMAAVCEAEGELDRGAVEQALDFMLDFAEGCHHRKEVIYFSEQLPAREGRPLAISVRALLRGGGRRRRHLAALNAAAVGAAAGVPGALRYFAEHARAYAGLLRARIRSEDRYLVWLVEGAPAGEGKEPGSDPTEEPVCHIATADAQAGFCRTANDLADRFHVPRAAIVWGEDPVEALVDQELGVGD
jgi:hemerythrin-like domain-containing protein